MSGYGNFDISPFVIFTSSIVESATHQTIDYASQSPTHRQFIETSRQLVADQSQHISNQTAINRQQVANQPPTGRRFFTDSSRPPIANRSPTGRRLVADSSATKNGGFDRTVVALVAADLWSQISCRQVAVHVWPGLKRRSIFSWLFHRHWEILRLS